MENALRLHEQEQSKEKEAEQPSEESPVQPTEEAPVPNRFSGITIPTNMEPVFPTEIVELVTPAEETSDIDLSEPTAEEVERIAEIQPKDDTVIINNSEVVTSDLPPITDEAVIFGILKHDQFFNIKKEQIQAFFETHTDHYERLEFVKRIFNTDYSEFNLGDSLDTRYGYKAYDKGLHIWKGSFMSHTMESGFSWDLVQSLYADMVEHSLLIDVQVSEIDEPVFAKPNEPKKFPEPEEDVNEGAEQLSFFGEPVPVEQTTKKAQHKKDKKKQLLNVDPSIKAISNDMIYYVLRCGSPEHGSLSRIVAQFQKGKTDEENADFLRKEFGNDGRGYIYNTPDFEKTAHISSWFDDFGIRINLGDNVDEDGVPNSKIPWLIAARRINDLLERGEFCSQDIIDSAAEKEIKNIADDLWYLHQDTDKEIYQYFIPDEMFKGGFPDSTKRIKISLLDKDTLQEYINGMEQFISDYEQNHEIMRFHFHKPKELLYNVKYDVTSVWDDYSNVNVTLTNTGDEAICNWALKYDTDGDIENIWNGVVFGSDEEYSIIKNAGYNYEVAPNGSISFGYTAVGADDLPESIVLSSERKDYDPEDYSVTLNVENDWGTGFTGNISIEAVGDKTIEAWRFLFDANFDLSSVWNATLLDSENNRPPRKLSCD